MAKLSRIILGIDPGLAHTGWGIVRQEGSRLSCVAYGCVTTGTGDPLPARLLKIKRQIDAVIQRYNPSCVGIETVWFGQNVTAAFGTGQARGAALVAAAEHGLPVGEFTPNAIKMSVVGQGHAEKSQVQYMVAQILRLEKPPQPDHAADALAAAVCYVTHERQVTPVLSALEERVKERPTKNGYQAAVENGLPQTPGAPQEQTLRSTTGQRGDGVPHGSFCYSLATASGYALLEGVGRPEPKYDAAFSALTKRYSDAVARALERERKR